MSLHAKDLMTENPVFCTPEDPVSHAARLMEDNDCGSLPVVEDASSLRLVGMITDRDIALRVVARRLPHDTKVKEVMTRNTISSKPDDDLENVERLMESHQLRRIPVVNDQGLCIGIVAQADLARERGRVASADFARVVERISAPMAGPHGSGGGLDD